ncbi:MAG TPA: XdhC family protein [Alphaproteobacteria bacterium]|jgi:xanthine/CO dehydrogenase XdhC/CoxF family maturation factor|nr:XdhC family protein [Alphaproteobacteria bacterium]
MADLPENDDVLRVLNAAAGWQDEGRKVALATVVQTWGSSPRPVGSQMAIADDGRFEGSVSGGCVEAAVVEAGQQSMADVETRLLTFGVADAEAWAVGLACGGTIRIFVEPVTA